MPAPKENSFPKRKVQKKQRFFQTKTLVQKSTPRPKESVLPETETLPRKGNLFSFRNEISLPNGISHSKNLRPASADKNRQAACQRGLVQDRGRVDFATPNTPPVLQKSTVREDEASVKKKLHLFHGELLLPNEITREKISRAKKRAPSKRERPSRNRNTPAKGKKSHFIFRHNTAHLSLSQPNESKQASTSFLEKPNNFRIPKNPPYFSRKIPKFTPKQAVHFLQKDSP